jgi:hypothetical protein
MVDDEFLGRARSGMRLTGQTSGAECVVVSGGHANFTTDSTGYVRGVMSIQDPKFKHGPKFETGVKTFRLTPLRVMERRIFMHKGL